MIWSDSHAQLARKLVLRKMRSTSLTVEEGDRDEKEGREEERGEKGEPCPNIEPERECSC